jgi:uncharacterized protein
MAIERASFGLREIKLAPSEVEGMTFSGYGAVFGNVDAYGDVIQPGAFADTLASAQRSGVWPAMLLQHGGYGVSAEDMTPIGIWTGLSEDGVGLKVEGKFADTARGREAYALLKMQPRPAIDGLSIGYIPKDWTQRSKPEEPRRTLKRVDLLEVSLVTFPANGKARVSSVKSLDNERDIERWLMQDAGLSRSEARIVINSGFKSLLAKQDAGSADDCTELSELAEALKRSTAALQA